MLFIFVASWREELFCRRRRTGTAVAAQVSILVFAETASASVFHVSPTPAFCTILPILAFARQRVVHKKLARSARILVASWREELRCSSLLLLACLLLLGSECCQLLFQFCHLSIDLRRINSLLILLLLSGVHRLGATLCSVVGSTCISRR